MERHANTIQQRLACIEEAHKEKNSFTTKAALSTLHCQLGICKKKVTGNSHNESRFCSGTNTLLSNIITKHKLPDLGYNKSLNHYLDMETVARNKFLPKERIDVLKKWSGTGVKQPRMHKLET